MQTKPTASLMLQAAIEHIRNENNKSVSEDSTMATLGFDSLDMVELMSTVEEETGTLIRHETFELDEDATLSDWARAAFKSSKR